MSSIPFFLAVMVCCSLVDSKPTKDNGVKQQDKGDGVVANMAVSQEQEKEEARPSEVNTKSDDVNHIPEVKETLNPQSDPGQEDEARQEDGGRQVDNNPAVKKDTGPVHDDDDYKAEVEQDSTKKEHAEREEVKEDIDWGHGGEKEDMLADLDLGSAIKQKQQQHKEQQKEQKQAQEEQQKDQKKVQQNEQQIVKQEERFQRESEQRKEKLNEQQKEQEQEEGEHAVPSHGERNQEHGDRPQGDAHETIGVMEPEHLMHGDEVHGDPHEGVKDAATIEKDQAEKDRQAQLKFETEQKELQDTYPKISGNVHDGTARKVAEFMKHQQFGPNDVEEVIHGGGHVHEKDQDGKPKAAQAGDLGALTQGAAGANDGHGGHEKDKVPHALDPEEMMHAGQGIDHVHDQKPEQKKTAPGAKTPVDTITEDHRQGVGIQNQAEPNVEPVGPDYEKIIHNGKHVHQTLPDDYKPAHRVRYQDILDLGLDQELLKGIDLSGLLEQEKKEMEAFHKDINAKLENNGEASEDGEDSNETERSAMFWKQVTDLRKSYLQKLYAKVRHITNPDPEHAEWDTDVDSLLGQKDKTDLHEGESAIEHEMEMWASTIAKGNRKPLKVMQEQWAKIKEEHQGGEKTGAKGYKGNGQEGVQQGQAVDEIKEAVGDRDGVTGEDNDGSTDL